MIGTTRRACVVAGCCNLTRSGSGVCATCQGVHPGLLRLRDGGRVGRCGQWPLRGNAQNGLQAPQALQTTQGGTEAAIVDSGPCGRLVAGLMVDEWAGLAGIGAVLFCLWALLAMAR